jgi:hypothetical protein
MEIDFKISKNWGYVKSFDELVNDAKFIFTHTGYKGKRPMIVLNNYVSSECELDCVEIDYDRWGILINGVTKFSESWGERITDSSLNVVDFIEQFLIKDGAQELLTNPPSAGIKQ